MARLVAIKVLTSSGDRAVRERLDRELATVGQLGWHPQVVTVLEHGFSPAGAPYLVMPWYSGGSLAGEPPPPGALSAPDAPRVGVPVRVAAPPPPGPRRRPPGGKTPHH